MMSYASVHCKDGSETNLPTFVRMCECEPWTIENYFLIIMNQRDLASEYTSMDLNPVPEGRMLSGGIMDHCWGFCFVLF